MNADKIELLTQCKSTIKSLAGYHNTLINQDWFSAFSDDHTVYAEGAHFQVSLTDFAVKNGPAFAWLRWAHRKHVYSGEPWGNEKKPRPLTPTVLTLEDLIEIRGEFEKLSLSGDQLQERHAIIDQVYQLGAIATGGDFEPSLLLSNEELRQAWLRGQKDAHTALRELLEPFSLRMQTQRDANN